MQNIVLKFDEVFDSISLLNKIVKLVLGLILHLGPIMHSV